MNQVATAEQIDEPKPEGPADNGVKMPPESISQRASAGVSPPAYWRDAREIILSNAGEKYEKAFLALQNAIDPLITADKDNPFTKSSYTSLGQLLADIRPILHENGFTIKQFCGAIRGHGDGAKRWHSLPVATKFMHVESLQWEMVICDIPVDQSAHSVASAMTYGKRYGPQSYLGIATADDDGMTKIRSKVDQEQAEEAAAGLVEQIRKIDDEAKLAAWVKKNDAGFPLLSEATLALVRAAYEARRKELKANNAGRGNPMVDAMSAG